MKIFLRNILFFTLIILFLSGFSYIFNRLIVDHSQLLKFKGNKLFVGASRGECAVVDDIIGNSLNASSSGETLFFSFTKIREFKRANQSLDSVILTLNHRTIDKNISEHFNREISLEEKLPKYYHLFDLNDLSYLIKLDFYSTVKSIFFLPKYSLRLTKRIIFNPNNNSEILDIGGYKYLDRTIRLDGIDHELSEYNSAVYEISPEEVSTLLDIIKFCDSNNISLIFLNPPIHHSLYNSQEYKNKKLVFDEFIKKNFNKFSYFDYSGESFEDSCFADLIHLNYKGAEIFSKILSEKLKSTKQLEASDLNVSMKYSDEK